MKTIKFEDGSEQHIPEPGDSEFPPKPQEPVPPDTKDPHLRALHESAMKGYNKELKDWEKVVVALDQATRDAPKRKDAVKGGR